MSAELLSLMIMIQQQYDAELAKSRYSDPRCLLRAGAKVFSQNDEDGIIEEIFKRIGTKSKTFVEIGVDDGVTCNTRKLMAEGWAGLWLSADQHHTFNEVFQENINQGRLTFHDVLVTPQNINGLLLKHEVDRDVDLLSIDIDFNDYWVWDAIDVIEPRVVVIEYNATLRPPMCLTVPYRNIGWKDRSYYFGASLNALEYLGHKKNYKLVCCNYSGVNAFFVRDDLFATDIFLSGGAQQHYQPARYWFQSWHTGHIPGPGNFVDPSKQRS